MSEQEIRTLQNQISILSEDIKTLQKTVQPIADIYVTVLKLGRWAAILLGTIGAIMAILVGIKNLFTHK